MKQTPAPNVIYVVTGHTDLNDRVKKVVDLALVDSEIVLIAPNIEGVACKTLTVKPYTNPTGILRVAGLSRIKRAVDRYLFFPSTRVLYVRPLVKVLKKRIARDLEQGRTVSMLICVPPHDMCLLGLALKSHSPGLFWITDWQDLWSYDENYYQRIPRVYRTRLLGLEKRIFGACDLNITTNAYAKAVLEEEFRVPANRVIAIPHHFSSDDLNQQRPITPVESKPGDNGTVKIGFLGTLFKPPRVPGNVVCEAIRELNASGLNVQLHVRGLYPKDTSADALARMRADGLIFHGPTNHEESLQSLFSYDFLLLLLADLPNSRAVMSIKLPHYMLTGRPIIAIVPERSAVADAVRRTGTGYVVPIEGDWRGQLKNIITGQGEPPMLRRDARLIEAYSWDNLLSEWKAVFARAATQSLRN